MNEGDEIYIVVGTGAYLHVAVASYVKPAGRDEYCWARYLSPAGQYTYGFGKWAKTWEAAQKIAVKDIEAWRKGCMAEAHNGKTHVRQSREEPWMRKQLNAMIEQSRSC